MGDFGKILDEQKFRNESDGTYAFKPQPDRYLCFFKKGKKIIVTNAYRKQSQKLPKSEKDLALKHMADYLARQAKVSPTVIQKLRPKDAEKVTLTTFTSVLRCLGYQIKLEKCPSL